MTRNCFLGEDLATMSFDYMHKFWKTYPGKRKFMINKILAAKSLTGEKSRYTDVDLAKTLEKMNEERLLDNTIIYLYSDHANHLDFKPYRSRSGSTERMNPLFMLILPDHVAEKHHDKLRTNQQRLMSHY